MTATPARPQRGRAIHWTTFAIIIGVPVLLFAATNAVVLHLDPGKHYLQVFRGDMFYYLANARELFENGNGLFYSDPFSASFSGPRVFSHLELVLFGWTWRLSGLPLPTVWQAAQIVFGCSMLLALYHLLASAVERRLLAFTFAVVALAGGAEWAVSVSEMTTAEQPLSYLEAFGLSRATRWLPNVFQNVPFATQSFYHTIAFATFAAALNDRRGLALLGLSLAWWSHPFTGLQTTAILGVHAAIESLLVRDRRAHEYTCGAAAVGGVFLVYYLVALPAWSPEAADITQRWRGFRLAVLSVRDLPAMWGLFLLWPLFFLSRRIRPVDPSSRKDRFLCTWIGVVVVLLSHDRLLPDSIPHFQPGHFAHGYLFVPMAVLTVRGLARLVERWPARWRRIGAAAFLIVAVADNVSFTVQEASRTTRPYFTPTQIELTDFLAEQEPGLVLLLDVNPLRRSTSLLNGSILSVLTPHRYYLYSQLQTPWYEKKYKSVGKALRSPRPAEHAATLGIRWIVLVHGFEAFDGEIAAGRARVGFTNEQYRVLEIPASEPGQPPRAAPGPTGPGGPAAEPRG